MPAVVRPAFTLGGHGGGFADDLAALHRQVERGLSESPIGQVLVEESIRGWDEFELEVIRDRADNVVIVCSIENLDPMGVHTGDSVTVAPQMTLSDEAYQELRDAAAAVIRAVGVETGGSNIQFARHRETGELRVIEMNPRVSRSSALASKATGYPIAKVAAKLAVGYTLDEIPNDLTKTTPASFEPTLDYVVVKFPRFAFEKFPGADPTLGTQMKSVGEAMGIGRTFTEAFLKAFGSRELDPGSPTPWATIDDIPEGLHPWFVEQLEAAQARAAHGRHPPGEAGGVGRRLDRRGVGNVRRRRAPHALRTRHQAGLPSRRLVRRRGGGGLELLLLDLGRGGRGPTRRDEAARRDPRLRPEPDRAGDRVRLLLRPRRPDVPGARLRGGDGQLQPGDRLDRLRHLGPPLLRAALARGGARRARPGAPTRRGDAVRRPDTAPARAPHRGRRLPDHGHAARGHRPGRGPRAVRRARARPRRPLPTVVDGRGSGGGARGRPRDRLSGARPAVVRARRARDADLRRRARPARGDGRRERLRPDRPLRRERDRDRRRRAVRRHGRLHRRGDAARRGGGRPLRRLVLRAARAVPHARQRARGRARRQAARARARRRRPAQRPACDRRRDGLRPRGEPARVAHRALREQGDRRQSRRGRVPARRRREDRRPRAHAAAALRGERQGGRAAVRPLPGRRSGARARRCARRAR